MVHHPIQMDEMIFIWKNITDVGLLYIIKKINSTSMFLFLIEQS